MSETIDPGRLQQELKRVANTTWLPYEERTMLLESAKAMEALRRLQQELADANDTAAIERGFVHDEMKRAEQAEQERDYFEEAHDVAHDQVDELRQQLREAEQERDALCVQLESLQRSRDAFADALAVVGEEREALRDALRESPHDMQCHPSEGRHSERCQRVRALLALTRPTDSTEAP